MTNYKNSDITFPKGTTMNAEEQYCPICASHVGTAYSAHRCKDSVYSGIDRANTRHENGNSPEFPRSFAQRLSEGYELLGLEEKTDED